MTNINVSTYNGTQRGESYIFALSKGANAGKPSRQPFPNSFAIKCSGPVHADLVFSVLFALHCARAYESELIGSVIVFIRIGDFRKIFFRALMLCSDEEALKAVGQVAALHRLCDQQRKTHQKAEKLLREYAQLTFQKLLNNPG